MSFYKYPDSCSFFKDGKIKWFSMFLNGINLSPEKKSSQNILFRYDQIQEISNQLETETLQNKLKVLFLMKDIILTDPISESQLHHSLSCNNMITLCNLIDIFNYQYVALTILCSIAQSQDQKIIHNLEFGIFHSNFYDNILEILDKATDFSTSGRTFCLIAYLFSTNPKYGKFFFEHEIMQKIASFLPDDIETSKARSMAILASTSGDYGNFTQMYFKLFFPIALSFCLSSESYLVRDGFDFFAEVIGKGEFVNEFIDDNDLIQIASSYVTSEDIYTRYFSIYFLEKCSTSDYFLISHFIGTAAYEKLIESLEITNQKCNSAAIGVLLGIYQKFDDDGHPTFDKMIKEYIGSYFLRCTSYMKKETLPLILLILFWCPPSEIEKFASKSITEEIINLISIQEDAETTLSACHALNIILQKIGHNPRLQYQICQTIVENDSLDAIEDMISDGSIPEHKITFLEEFIKNTRDALKSSFPN